MTDHQLAVIILAAGRGTRMRSSTPKVLHRIAGLSLVGHVLATAGEMEAAHVVAVVRHERDRVVEVLSDSTAAIDRGPKVEAFRSLETPEAHRLVEKDRPHADLFVRNAEGLWALNPAGEGGTLTIVALGVELSMAAVYE